MEWNEATTLELADRVNGFATTWNAERAEAHVAAKVAELRQRFTQDGIDVTPAEAIATIEAQTRQQWDTQAREDGIRLEQTLAGAAAVIADRIEWAKDLPTTVEPLASRQERQLEEFIALAAEDRYRARFATQTRAEALTAYQAADEATQAGRRLVVFLEAQWSALAFRDDPEHDAIAITQWHAVRDARRLARASKDDLAQHARLVTAQKHLSFTETLRHLRSGRGIAVRPKPTTLRIA